MAKPKSSTGKDDQRTINVRANEQFLQILGLLKDEFGLSMSDSIRQGVSILFTIKRQTKKGRRVVFVDSDGNVILEFNS
jgi:hypothetical protein